ncbi:hypothetical protein FRB91_002843 [Serendipita sp. 411]|nr:hypothetical protein FRB91_002843 [Serendipita sp. 411]
MTEKTDHKFWHEDGNIIYCVDGTLYKIHRYFLKGSSLDITLPRNKDSMDEGLTPDNPITLSGVEKSDFEALLEVLYQTPMAPSDALPIKILVSALEQASKWDFEEVARNISLNLQRREHKELNDLVAVIACCATHSSLFSKTFFLEMFYQICNHTGRFSSEFIADLNPHLLSAIMEGREIVREATTGKWLNAVRGVVG